MRLVKRRPFHDVEAYEMGWSPAGPPMMTVHFFVVDGLVIDTGQPHMEKACLEILRDRRLEGVLLTHYHEDHSGNAAAVKSALGIPVMGDARTAEKMERAQRLLPYQHFMWGRASPVAVTPFPRLIETGHTKLIPVHTPGHSKDHTAYWEPDKGWLFSGDLYLGDRVKYFRADEKIADEISSLKKVLALDFEALFCSHRPMPRGGKRRIEAKLSFLEDFYGKVARLWHKGMHERAIMRALQLKEDRVIQWMCFGNVSMRQMVRSVIHAETAHRAEMLVPANPVSRTDGQARRPIQTEL
jgi:glyoxylase-like metal-dependent hydrolase (beta-lactamase superfamily II)